MVRDKQWGSQLMSIMISLWGSQGDSCRQLCSLLMDLWTGDNGPCQDLGNWHLPPSILGIFSPSLLIFYLKISIYCYKNFIRIFFLNFYSSVQGWPRTKKEAWIQDQQALPGMWEGRLCKTPGPVFQTKNWFFSQKLHDIPPFVLC